MALRLLITYGQATHVGLRRSDNQDACGKYPLNTENLSFPKGQLFIVADGMGGHQGGQEASQMAVEIIGTTYHAHSSGNAAASLGVAFQAANEHILERSTQNPELQGMGTTCTVLVLQQEEAFIAHVGDSRAYRIRQDAFEQLTNDHSQVAEMVRQGFLTEDEAERHPRRNVLSRAMGVMPDLQVDLIEHIPLQPGDSFLICSDGLARVTAEEIQDAVRSLTPSEACVHLVQIALDRGGHDNVTVQIIRVDQAHASLLPLAGSSITALGAWQWLGLAVLLVVLVLTAMVIF